MRSAHISAGAGGAPGAEASRAGPYVALALLTVFWGYSWVAVRVATRDAAPLQLAAMRAVLGSAVLFAFCAATRRPLRPPPPIPTLVYGLLQTAAFTLLQTFAVALGGAGRAAVLAYTMPFWTVLFARAFLGERIPRLRAVALVLAAVGVGLLATPLRRDTALAGATAVGAGLVWGLSVVWAVRLRRAGSDVVALTAWQMAYGALALVAVALAMPGEVRWTASFALALAFLAFVATGACWAMWAYLLSRLSPSTAGIAMLGTPVASVAIAAVQLREVPSRGEALAMLCMVAALALNLGAGRRVRARPGRGAAERSRS